jgi:hypothetical protein
MDCRLIDADLIAFHFGLLEDEGRVRVEEHLRGCATCVGQFLTLKRAIEVDDAPRPSAALRTRLRASVASELRPTRRLLRPAIALGLVALALTIGALWRRGAPLPAPGPTIDSPSTANTSLRFL